MPANVTNIAEIISDFAPCLGKKLQKDQTFPLQLTYLCFKPFCVYQYLSLLAGGGKRCGPRNNPADLSTKKMYPVSEKTAEGFKCLQHFIIVYCSVTSVLGRTSAQTISGGCIFALPGISC